MPNQSAKFNSRRPVTRPVRRPHEIAGSLQLSSCNRRESRSCDAAHDRGRADLVKVSGRCLSARHVLGGLTDHRGRGLANSPAGCRSLADAQTTAAAAVGARVAWPGCWRAISGRWARASRAVASMWRLRPRDRPHGAASVRAPLAQRLARPQWLVVAHAERSGYIAAAPVAPAVAWLRVRHACRRRRDAAGHAPAESLRVVRQARGPTADGRAGALPGRQRRQ
ncbi:uncharacterized protein V1510DRAFT_409915 [Dipodascopsis tothii]|uniref:uncharacterized protein n=1 Tax=Dipodascopsis tothii TaxID=44089 RepID=UPI0034CD8619